MPCDPIRTCETGRAVPRKTLWRKHMLNAIRNAAHNAYARAGVAVTLATIALPGFAQTTDPFDTAMTTVTEKVEQYAGALVGLAAVGVVFMIAIKYVKKIRGAA